MPETVPDVQMIINWQGDKITASVTIDKIIKMNFDISPVTKIDEAVTKYLDVANAVLKSFAVKK